MGRWVILVLGVATLALACGDSEGSSASQAGGTPASSGSSNPSGGFRTTPSGGTTSSTGGRTASGGSLTSFGGLENTNTGGKSASGGRNPASGGSAETSGGTSEATGGGGPAGAGGAQNPLECPELPGPSPDPDDGGAFPGPLSIVLGNEAQLGTYSTIEGNLTIGPSAPPTGARIETIDLTHLRVVEGDLMIRYTAMAEIELPRLERVTGQLWVTHNQQLTELRMPELTHTGALYLDANLELTRSEFPKLESVDTTLYVHRNVKLVSWGLDALSAVGGVIITANLALPQCVVDAFNADTGEMASSEATDGPPVCDCTETCGRLDVDCD